MDKLVNKVNLTGRFMLLDLVSALGKEGAGHLYVSSEWGIVSANPENVPKGVLDNAQRAASDVLIDWNEAMRVVNYWCDRAVAALSKPTREERDAAVAEYDRDLAQLGGELQRSKGLLGLAWAGWGRRLAGAVHGAVPGLHDGFELREDRRPGRGQPEHGGTVLRLGRLSRRAWRISGGPGGDGAEVHCGRARGCFCQRAVPLQA